MDRDMFGFSIMARSGAAGMLLAFAVACSQPEQGSEAGGPQAQPFYAAKARSSEFLTPDTGSYGKFRVEKNCLIFVSEQGLRFLPVFPADTSFASTPGKGAIATVKGREIHSDRTYSVKGGTSQYGLASPPPETCPSTHFLVGRLL
jgi:hypothetical protein